MKKHLNHTGFTIIEVTLVLAIAGLIFLMVFIALPSLRASQRDTSRREDVMSFISGIKKYQSNNRGALPNDWDVFRDDYLGGKDKNNFTDPTGEQYNLNVSDCQAASVDSPCEIVEDIDSTTFPNNYTLYVVTQATCKGPNAVGTSNPRKVAVLYRLESAGVYCSNT